MQHCMRRLSAAPWPLEVCGPTTAAAASPSLALGEAARALVTRCVQTSGAVLASRPQKPQETTRHLERLASHPTAPPHDPAQFRHLASGGGQPWAPVWQRRCVAALADAAAPPASTGVSGLASTLEEPADAEDAETDAIPESVVRSFAAQQDTLTQAEAEPSDDEGVVALADVAEVGWRRRWGKEADSLAGQYFRALQSAKSARSEPLALQVRPACPARMLPRAGDGAC